MLNSKSIPNPPYSLTEKILEAISIVIILLLWLYFVHVYHKLPERIPSELGSAGQVTDWGGKDILKTILYMLTVIILLSTTLSHFPRLIQLSLSVKDRGISGMYLLKREKIRMMNFEYSILFGYILIAKIEIAQHNQNFNDWLPYLWFIVMIVTMIIYNNREKRLRC